MRPLSPLFVGVLPVAVALGCRDTPVDPIRQTTLLQSLASAQGPAVLCLASPGVTQHSNGQSIIVVGTNDGEAINCANASLPVVVHALGGNDVVVGSAFDDNLNGGTGCDRVSGGPGNDRVEGGPGNDGPANAGGCTIPAAAPYIGFGIFLPAGGALRGSGGDDLLRGGPGNDGLTGDDGVDVCEGGPGSDNLTFTCEVKNQGPAGQP